MKLINLSIIVIAITGIFFTSCAKNDYTPPPNIVVKAGPLQTIQLPIDSVTLTGTVISGQSPTLVYSWTFVVGPNTPVILNSNSTIATVKGLVAGTYIFQFSATNNTSTVIGEDTVSVVVTTRNPIIKTITIQPGISTGQDAEVWYQPGSNSDNGTFGGNGLLEMSQWTYYANGLDQGTVRSFIKFTALDTLPANAIITSAKLSLYAVTNTSTPGYIGDSYYPGSPYNSYGDNSGWLQRATSNWDQSTITYNNQPAVDTKDEVVVPASTSQYNYNITDLDITQLIKDMKTTPGTNFGFCMRLQNEVYYRETFFDASEAQPDSSTGPKLVVTYQY